MPWEHGTLPRGLGLCGTSSALPSPCSGLPAMLDSIASLKRVFQYSKYYEFISIIAAAVKVDLFTSPRTGGTMSSTSLLPS
eukprot:NODE_25644_length_580_cov_1.245033.p1 GENE.NODE_25644_length_580_cov_1.245033~~NODE_25644_length_580_cov_1.245033.p1  ORF type:complete len:81 (+),score=14.70 NODE_25644_length_580_cov_1.245033:110-352(+)